MKWLLVALIGIAATTLATAAPVEPRGGASVPLGDLDVVAYDDEPNAVIRDGRFQLGVLAEVLPIGTCIPAAIEATVRVRIHLPRGLSLESGSLDSTFTLKGRPDRSWTVQVRASRDGQYRVANELAVDYPNGDRERSRWLTVINVFEGQKVFGLPERLSAELIPNVRPSRN